MPAIDDLSDAEFIKLQAEYGDNLPICAICTLEDVRHLLLELVAGVSDEVKNAFSPMLYAVTGALVTDRTMAEQGEGSAHLGGDDDVDDEARRSWGRSWLAMRGRKRWGLSAWRTLRCTEGDQVTFRLVCPVNVLFAQGVRAASDEGRAGNRLCFSSLSHAG
jgi:hypothetical protein